MEGSKRKTSFRLKNGLPCIKRARGISFRSRPFNKVLCPFRAQSLGKDTKLHMKKIVSSLAALILTMCLLLPFTASAASATASLSGPGTVRAGDSITLTFKLNGSGLSGASGTLSYDGSQLQMTGTKQVIASPWAVEWSGNNMVAYDNNLSAPINGGKDLFTVSFKVKNVAEGTKITVSYTDVMASDGSADANIGTVSYSATVAAPLSTNNALASLTVSNAVISPAFSPDTTSYTADVPFSVSKLDVQAAPADTKAKVSISSPTLTPDGTTNVTITVTAESGAKKTYTIKVHREKDPNYVASGNNALADITVDGFLLSPVFSADVTEYVVWLPYETETVSIGGKAADSKAGVQVIGGDNLAAGQDNPVKIICTAENGERKEYTVVVKRAAAHDGRVDEKPAEPTTEPIQTTTAADTPADTQPAPVSGGIPWWVVLIVGIICLGGGFGGGYLVFVKLKVFR